MSRSSACNESVIILHFPFAIFFFFCFIICWVNRGHVCEFSTGRDRICQLNTGIQNSAIDEVAVQRWFLFLFTNYHSAIAALDSVVLL